MQEKLPDCKVAVSTTTLRSDHGKSTFTANQLTNDLLQSNIDITDRRDINSRYLSWKGLH